MAHPVGEIDRITSGEVTSVLEIQRDCYSEWYLEDSRMFEQMIAVYPQGCLGVKVDGVLAAYAFFHPYREDAVKPLDDSLTLDGGEDCMYLHDFAVHPRFRGMGFTRMLMERVDHETWNEGFDVQCLVAVQDSKGFWMNYGFEPVRQVEGYGGGPAHYMKRSL